MCDGISPRTMAVSCVYITYMYMVDSHESDAFGPYFEKDHFLNIQNKERLYITHSEARHLT